LFWFLPLIFIWFFSFPPTFYWYYSLI
jgi:hypothetical protein